MLFSIVSDLPACARVVIVGGGIVGCSVAYHLAKLGWRDVVLLERNALTSGTTWHAAGLVGQLRSTYNLTQLAKYSTDLFQGLAADTGQETGFKQNGSISIATNAARLEELRRGASMARCCGLEVEEISVAEALRRWPMMSPEGIAGVVFLPRDGQTNPVDTTLALARGARAGGVRIFEKTGVTGILKKAGKVTGVQTARGEIAAEFVVNCGGLWGWELGRKAGVNVPLHAAEHFYLVTEPIPGLPRDLPVLRSTDICTYFKEDAGKLLLGFFEPHGKPWGMKGIPDSDGYIQLQEDWDHVLPYLELATQRVPVLRDTGIKLFFNGPESFTPDNRYILGEAPECRNFFVATGFNSVGIQSSGGAGKAVAEWIVRGHAPMDLWDVDVRRFMPFQGTPRFLHDRTKEALGLLYDMHWPYRQSESARGVRRSPLHGHLLERNACFGEVAGWERANWFAPPGVVPKYEYSYGRQNWFAYSAAEHKAAREGVALFDQSSFGKFLVQGRDAQAVLNRICANDVAVEPGRIVYTQWLNERGGIEADLTVTRLDVNAYLIVTAAATQVRDLHWLGQHIPEESRAVVTDVTSAYAVLGVMGPQSRTLLSRLTDADLSTGAFPFGVSREIELGYARVRASRITYVGELGWELYVPAEFAAGVYEALISSGEGSGLVHAGYHAMDSLRMEKGYRHWGHDIADEDTPLQAGLAFAVAFGKRAAFIGREALERQKSEGLRRRLVLFALDDPEPLVYHNEPIWRSGRLVGRVTSGAYGHTLGRSLCMGYVSAETILTPDYLLSGAYEIEIASTRFSAKPSLRPFYDPMSERIRKGIQ